MVGQYAFWIPLCPEEKLGVVCNCLRVCALQDDPGKPAIMMQGTLDTANYNIILEYWIGSKGERQNIVFVNDYHSDKGLLVYHIDFESLPQDCFMDSLKEELSRSVYHYFKEFFHRHQYHDEEADSILPVWSSKTQTAFGSVNKKELFGSIIENYCIRFSGFYDEIGDTAETQFGNLRRNEEISKSLHVIEKQIKVLTDLLYETAYSMNLCELFPNDISRNDKRRLKGRIATLRKLHERITFRYNLIAQSISIDLGISGKNWGVAGVTIGMLSILLTLVLALFQCE